MYQEALVSKLSFHLKTSFPVLHLPSCKATHHSFQARAEFKAWQERDLKGKVQAEEITHS